MIPIHYFLILSVVLFVLGIAAFFIKKDLITQFMSIEVMLNAANLAFITFAKSHGSLDGQIIVFFIITVAAAEAAVGLAIVIAVFRNRETINSDALNIMKW